eukprot:scaffold14681_cov163-Skeletonema_dohrnii-CCMP3373.AAC.1
MSQQAGDGVVVLNMKEVLQNERSYAKVAMQKVQPGEIDRRITSPAQEFVHVGATLESDSENIGATL